MAAPETLSAAFLIWEKLSEREWIVLAAVFWVAVARAGFGLDAGAVTVAGDDARGAIGPGHEDVGLVTLDGSCTSRVAALRAARFCRAAAEGVMPIKFVLGASGTSQD